MTRANSTSLHRRRVAPRRRRGLRAGRGAARAGGAADANQSGGDRRARDRARRRSRDRSRQRRHLGRQGRHHRPGGAGDHHHHHGRRDQGARSSRTSLDALATVPGWYNIHAIGNQVELPAVRGVGQASLLMRDGLSLFDPWGNISPATRTQPLETVKRIEVVTGPGGVLWGANSFLGIVNLITKDAEDVNGLELAAGYGDGPGNKQDFRAYAMFGKTFFNGKLKIFQHISYENFIGEVYNIPQFLVSTPAPQPGGIAYFATNAPRDPGAQLDRHRRRQVLVRPGLASTTWCRSATSHPSLAFANAVVQGDTWNIYDRYGVLEYKDRFAKDRVGLTRQGLRHPVRARLRDPALPVERLPAAQSGDRRAISAACNFSFAGQQIFRFGGHGRPRRQPAVPHPPARRRRVLLRRSCATRTSKFADPRRSRRPAAALPGAADGTRRLSRIPLCPRIYGHRHRPLRRRRLRRRAVAPVREADARRRRSYPEGLRRSALRPRAARLGRHRLQLPARLSTSSSTTRPASARRCSRTRRSRPAASPTARTRTSRPRRRSRSRASSTRDCCATSARCASSSCAPTTRTRCCRTSSRSAAARTATPASAPSTRSRATRKLYLNGDHFLQASYTYLNSTTTDAGVVRTTPNHWVVLGASFNIVKNLLDVNVNLIIFGAYEDVEPRPDRRRAARRRRGSEFTGTTTARTSDLDVRPPDAGGQPAARLPPALPARTSCSSRRSSTTCSTSTTTTPTTSTT